MYIILALFIPREYYFMQNLWKYLKNHLYFKHNLSILRFNSQV